MTDSKVKDKRITVSGCQYRATVEYYRDKPSRDNDTDRWYVFETLKLAQKWLAGFPRDDWTGYALSDYNYTEIDERKRHVGPRTSRGASPSGKNRSLEQRGGISFGRTIAGQVRGMGRKESGTREG